jgi:hypothetical protein
MPEGDGVSEDTAGERRERVAVPLPNHLAAPRVEYHWIVLEYADPPGWWRRCGTYDDETVALTYARRSSSSGTHAVVMQQRVEFSGMVLTASLLPQAVSADV